MKKFMLVCCLFAVVIFSSENSANAAEIIHLNVNGVKIEGENPVIINQTTMVPIRTISLIPIFTVDWDNQTKTVSVTNTVLKETLKLTMGKKEAYKGKTKLTLGVAPRSINGAIYVPLRFISESLDAYAHWDTETKTAVIYNSTVNDKDISKDLVTARNAVLALTRINLHDHLLTSSESFTTQYFFPYGQTQKFFIIDGDIVKYFEVKNHASWEVWEGKISDQSTQSNEKEAIPGLVQSVSKEWGKRPSYTGDYVVFTDHWIEGRVDYGILDKSGKGKELGTFTRENNSKPLVVAIEGEQRVD